MKRVFLATVLCVVNAVGLCACQGHNNGASTQNMQERDFADMTREEGEQAGVQLAKEVIAMTEDFADGYYFSFPFNRVTMLEKILD